MTGSTASGTPPPARTTDRPGTTGPATAHAPAPGQRTATAPRWPAGSSRYWKTPGWRSAAGTPRIPPVVIIIASGTDGKHPRWGHHAPGRWNVAGEQLTEIMISGEGLRRTAREVLATLLHEAAHALAHARGIKDTSRQGRYHNTKFKKCAEEVGLAVEHDDTDRLVRHHHHPRHRAGLRRPAPGPHRRHDALAARRNHHRTQGPAQPQPDRGHLPLRALHPRGRLHPGRGTHHLPGLRPGLPAQEPR